MPGKQNDEHKSTNDYADRTVNSVSVAMKGMDLKLMRTAAKMRAAQILQEDARGLWLISESSPRVTETARFEEVERPTELSVSYTFGVIPPDALPESDPDSAEPLPNVVSIKRSRTASPTTRRKK